MAEVESAAGSRHEVCDNCEALGHGNLTCPECVRVINEGRAARGLDPIPRFGNETIPRFGNETIPRFGNETIPPVGPDEVARFAARLNGGQP